ncbi:MAG: hypothetical protein ACQEXQ_06870 [Bacillota bacterium]
MKHLKHIYLIVVMIILASCSLNKPVPLTDLQIKEIAWNYIGEAQSIVVNSEEDIVRKDEGNGVTTIINGAAKDVWKQAEISNQKNNQIKLIEFETMFASAILVYVDISKGKAIKIKNKYNGTLQF